MNAFQELAAQLVTLQRRVDAGSTPQLGHSSLEDASLNEYDEGGQLVAIFGKQYDGTHGATSVAGPNPPKPDSNGVTIKQVPGGVLLTFDGTWESSDDRPTVAPMDFRLFEVHASTDSALSALLFSTKKADILSARGGEVLISLPRDTDHYFRIIARSESGKVGAASDVVGPYRAGKMVEEDLDIDFSQFGGTNIFYGPGAPTSSKKYGDLWLKELGTSTGAAGQPPAGTALYETRRWTPGTPDDWKLVQDQGITSSLQAAIAASQAAEARAQVFTQPGEPAWSGPTGSAIWFDSDAGNLFKIWDGDSFEPRPLGNGAIQPNSLVASDVIATGTVTAALFEALLVLTTEVIAGNPQGTHARLTPTGIRVYAEDLVDGIPNEVIRLGTDTNDYFGISDGNGALVASVDETGRGSFSGLNIQGDPVFQGVPYSETISEARAGRVLGYYLDKLVSDLTPVKTELGVVEVPVYLEAGRSYRIGLNFSWSANISNTGAIFTVRSTRTATEGGDDAPAPTITSTSEKRWWKSSGAIGQNNTENLELLYNATITGRHRFLFTAQVNQAAPVERNAICSGLVTVTPSAADTPTTKRVNFPWTYDAAPLVLVTASTGVPGTTVRGVSASAIDTGGFNATLTRTNTTATDLFWQAIGFAVGNARLTIDNAALTIMSVLDAGPTPFTTGQATAGGGLIGTNPVIPGGTAAPAPTQPPSPAPVKQQYYKELGPVGKISWRGNGQVRTDLGAWGVQQGNDPSGFNGIGKGEYWFNLPSITGTVDRVDLYLYSEHWYYNSGGTAVININDQRGADPNMYKMRGDWLVGGYAKPGGKWVTVPADWKAFFKGTTNTTFNGRATTITLGPTNTDLLYYGRFTDCRLRIWYTQ